MKKLSLAVIAIIIFSAFVFKSNKPVDPANNAVLQKGERITYIASYGPIEAVEGVFTINNAMYKINNRPCYKVDVTGKSIGVFGSAFTINNLWRSYIDADSKVSQKFYRNIVEGNYKRDETTVFDQPNRTLSVTINKQRTIKYRLANQNVHDMISAYFYLRTVDFTKYKPGQLITIYTFLDDKAYHFQLKYAGKEVVSTKFGKINAIKLKPQMPANKIFSGNEPVTLWISDDENKLPLKVAASMLVGTAELNINTHKGLKAPFKVVG